MSKVLAFFKRVFFVGQNPFEQPAQHEFNFYKEDVPKPVKKRAPTKRKASTNKARKTTKKNTNTINA